MNSRSTDITQGSHGVVHRVMQASFSQFSLVLLVFGFLVYGAFGSPTPDTFGIVEAVVGACLAMGVLGAGAYGFISFKGLPFWRGAGASLLVYGVSVPFMVGAISGADLLSMLRDIVPFLFMMLAVFMAARFEREPQSFKPVAIAAAGIGLLFSLRSLGVFGENQELYYLANMPSVFFVAFVSAGLALQVFTARFSFRCLPLVAGLVVVSLLTVLPMIEAQQRASIGVFVVLFAVLFGRRFVDYPKRAMVVFLVLAVVASLFLSDLGEVWGALRRKSELVGVNMRFEEMRAVWAAVNEEPLGVIFGLGWGARFSSPAVADIRIGYTHSLISGMMLKTGLIGVGLSFAYLGGLVGLLIKIKGHWVVVLALVGAMAIDTFLYASYKSLDFGVVLMLIPALYSYARFLDGETRSSIEREDGLV